MSSEDFRRCIVSVPVDDLRLAALVGAELSAPDAVYELVRVLATGTTSTTFFANRRSAAGELSVVVKVTLQKVVQSTGPSAALAIRKEAVSLGRLSAVASPNPFVIRLLDVGEVELDAGSQRTAVPWIALEYVHGGADGTTLAARVERTIAETGYGLDLRRAERAIRGLTSGLSAIHALRVIHRDICPEHVLCCGRGADEIMKIAEFGVARALGMKETFGKVQVGRPGYAAPELNAGERARIGPWSDVFSLGATVYFMLTGREYAKAIDPLAAFRGERAKDPSMMQQRTLHPELRARPEAVHALDRAIADAMNPDPDRRPQSVDVFASRLLGALQLGGRVVAPAGATSTPRSRANEAPPSEHFRWSVVARPRFDVAVRSVAWSGDGRALVITDRGLAFWDATRWAEPAAPIARGSRVVRSIGPGQWIVAGDGPSVQRFDGSSVVDVMELPRAPDSSRGALRVQHMSGDIEDLAAFVFASDAPFAPPIVSAVSGGRWLAPLPLGDVEVITALARLDDRRWMLAGRGRDGAGWLGVYEPLAFRIDRVHVPSAPTFLAAAGLPERAIGLACGLAGAVACFDGTNVIPLRPLPEALPLAAAAIDSDGRIWVASTGAIFCSAPSPGSGEIALRRAWTDARFQTPFGSLHADDGRVLAMTVDGGVVEGRLDLWS